MKKFYKNEYYVGLKLTHRDHAGEFYQKEQYTVFKGRPYSRHEWDAIVALADFKKFIPNFKWRSQSRVTEEPFDTILSRQELAISIL